MMEASKHTMYVGRAESREEESVLDNQYYQRYPYFLCSSDVPGRLVWASCMLDSCISVLVRWLVMLAAYIDPRSNDPTAARTNVSI